ncbi:MAG: hypothetical protein NXI23_16555 [Bacteroidetes bacterium]|nr:hypothetical protein [Bacteroidota bacterium]
MRYRKFEYPIVNCNLALFLAKKYPTLKVFPVINSTLSPVHLADLLNKQYDFDNSINCQLIRSGLNDSYLLSNSTEKYVF